MTNYASALGTPQAVGVGSNAVPNQEQDKLYEQFKGATLGAVGSGLSKIGASGVGNVLQRWGGMLNPKPVYASDGTEFSMKYYPGWGEAEARADWKATGGAKASNYNLSTATDVTPTTYNIGGQNVTANTPSEAIKSIYPSTDFEKYASQYNNDISQFLASIDAEAAAQYEFLNQQENALKEAKSAYEGIIAQDYATNLAKGESAKKTAASKLAQNKVQAEQQKQSALNAAKQLYNQLSQGYQQRFGGTSGASEAARAILGQEQQRQGGKIQQDYGNTRAGIQAQEVELENNYQNAIKELDLQKQKSMYEAQQNFMTNLATINNNRLLTTQAKEQAKRDLALQMRDEVNAINASNLQFQQNLALMREQAKLSLGTTTSGFQSNANQYAQTGANTVGSFADKYQNITSSLSPSGTTNYSVQNTPITYENAVGQYTPAKFNLDEYMSNNVNPYAQ